MQPFQPLHIFRVSFPGIFVCCLLLGLGFESTAGEGGKAEPVERLTRIIEGRSYPVAAKAAARVERAREYLKQGMRDQSADDCNVVLALEDDVYCMNPEDVKDIRLAKREARLLLDRLESKGAGAR